MAIGGLVAGGGLVACGDDDDAAAPTAPTSAAATSAETTITADRCLVRVHGRSERGTPAQLRDGYVELAPDGNGDYGDGYEWRYADPDDFRAARSVLEEAITASECRRVVLNGFSNGAAFTAKLACAGETFGDTLVGVVIDDPVPDAAVIDCSPAPDVQIALYWTGGLADATPGASCNDLGWTCEGDELLGIDAYAAAIGVEAQPSPFDEHRWHRDAPELVRWLTAG